MHRNDTVESQIRLYTDNFRGPVEIDIDTIELKQSHKHQNRPTKVNDENVLRMALSTELGVQLPPIIVNKVGSRKHIVDGVHRVEERKLSDKKTIWAYETEVDADTYAQMCLGANAGNGLPLTDHQRMVNALAQIELGLPATTAGKVWGIDPERLRQARRADEGRKKIAEAGLTTKGIRDGAAEVINRLEVDQIKSLGKSLEGATIKEVSDSVQAIIAAPAADRATEAVRQSIVLDTKRAERNKPKTRRQSALSGAQLRHRAKEILAAVRANHAHANDDELARLVDEIAKALADARRQAA